MPRKFPKPFFRTGRGWYVQLGKSQIKLADGPENPETEAAALQRYHEVMAERKRAPSSETHSAPNPARASDGLTIAEVLDKFLAWTQNHREPKTYEWYRDHLQSFLDHLGKNAALPAAALKPFHVVEWVDGHPAWSVASKRGSVVAVQRPFNWAEEMGYLAANPVKKIKKPATQRRDNPMTPEDFRAVLAKVKDGDPFRDLLVFAWHCGCRPQEVRHVEARHVHLPAGCLVLPKEEAKGKRRARVIHLDEVAGAIVTRLLAAHPEGKLFRNTFGRPWKKFAVCNRFDRLMLVFGKDKLKEQGVTLESVAPLPRFNRRAYADKAQLAAARKDHQQKLRDRRKQLAKLARHHGKGFACYDVRHGFCQRLLENGANHLAVAELMGHVSGRMVAETYSHMNRATAHLKETLKKANGGG